MGHNASDVLKTYTQDVARYPLLSVEEEVEVGQRALDGDKRAQDLLVRHNLRFVITVARRYQGRGVALMDLIQAGNIGITHAASRFDPSVGVRFISYAVYWIQQQIQRELDAGKGDVRASGTQMVRLRRVRKLQAEARQSIGRKLTVRELVEKTGFTEERVREALEYRVLEHGMDDPVGEDSQGTTLSELLPHDDGVDEKEADAHRKQLLGRLMSDVLSAREQDILARYYGLGERPDMSLTEIGHLEGVSRERARQLKVRAFKKISRAVRECEGLSEEFAARESS